MQKAIIWLGALVLTVTVQAQDFTRTMTTEEQAAAGLEKLSPAELAKLKAAVERYKAGAVAVVQEQAEQKVAATEAKVKEAEQKVVAAEVKAKEAESKAASVAAAEKKKGPSWLSALVTLKKAEAKPEAQEAIESRLAGSVSTFRGKRAFTLENGQVWQMIEADSYAGPTYERPLVRVRPGILGTFWLQIPEAAIRVKVKPIKLE